MSEEFKPEVQNTPDVAQEEQKTVKETLTEAVDTLVDAASDVAAAVSDKVAEVVDQVSDKIGQLKEEHSDDIEQVKETIADVKDAVVNYAEKTLAELSGLFESLSESVDRMKRSKEAEAIKSAFYKRLSKEKADAGLGEAVDEPVGEQPEEPVVEEPAAETASDNPFAAIEAGFKNLYNKYKKERAEYNRQLDAEREDNLVKKQAVIEDLKALIEEQGEMKDAFPKFREIQNRWREIGPVPATAFRDLNDTYQLYVEKFYDLVQINRDLRDLDFKKNLEAKTRLCEQVEEIATREIATSNEWNVLSKEIEQVQTQWRKIGFASKKENQKIYDRFRAACDKFFERKREYYSQFKDSMNENMEKKLALIEQAEALKTSTDWKKTTDQLINLQKQWKEIGAVPRKKSEQLWKRFRAACDEFFNERDKQARPENDFYGNLKAKKALIAEIEAFTLPEDEEAAAAAMREFNEKWGAIGFVPFKEKDAVNAAFRKAMSDKFPSFNTRPSRNAGAGRTGGAPRGPRSEKDVLVQKYNQLQQDIATYENNIGFFANSKTAESMIKLMHERIDAAKAELKELEGKIREIEAKETENE